ncbi:MAG TPA: hypothetical protein VHH33_00300 [Nitrososphaeraceae archaeon]|nr:hypothetical protein [Nitrososphaeraceae archaeon]
MQLTSPFFIEVSTIQDFGRLVCAFERIPLLTFSFKSIEKDLLATQIDFLNNVPVIYYVRYATQGQYLGYRNSNGIEDVSIVENIQNPSVMYSPIVSVDKFPPIFWRRPKGKKNSNYEPIKLSNFQSLIKIASYKMIYEESPLPLFVFKSTRKSKYVVGTALNMAESDGISYFYYATIPESPVHSFIKYSSLKSEDPTFTNNIEEHGYIYIKLIKLFGSHPLVKINE